MLTNQTQQPYPYPHIFYIACHMSLFLDGSNLVLVWHTPDILIQSQLPFWSPIVWCNPISLIAIIYLINDHDLDRLLIAIALLIASHIVWNTLF